MTESKHGKQGRYIDRFDVLLLDMGNTFMFDCDRFNLSDDIGRTYQRLGGKQLNSNQVHKILSDVFEQMCDMGRLEANYENIKGVSYYLQRHHDVALLDENELSILEAVFTEHEIGMIPDEYVSMLRELGKSHRLGIISDIWSRSGPFYHELEMKGIKDIFDVIVFSSDIKIIKPSGKIFAKAMEAFDADISKVAYIGDSFRRDVVGAKNFGISAIWIQRDQVLDHDDVKPDLIINYLSKLLV